MVVQIVTRIGAACHPQSNWRANTRDAVRKGRNRRSHNLVSLSLMLAKPRRISCKGSLGATTIAPDSSGLVSQDTGPIVPDARQMRQSPAPTMHIYLHRLLNITITANWRIQRCPCAPLAPLRWDVRPRQFRHHRLQSALLVYICPQPSIHIYGGLST